MNSRTRIATWTLLATTLFTAMPVAQQTQNPSPMVEHTRPHPRLPDTLPEGRHAALELGTLFVPKGVTGRARLVIHFHGSESIP